MTMRFMCCSSSRGMFVLDNPTIDGPGENPGARAV